VVFKGDRELLEAFRRAEAHALERVYWIYASEVESFVRHAIHRFTDGRTSARFDVQDVVQEVFLRAFGRAARLGYDDSRPYGAYLRTIARNEVIDRLRRSGREVLVETAALETLAVENPPDEEWADPMVMAKVEAYLVTLPPELRAVHIARYVDGLAQEVAASKLGLSRQRVRTLEGKLRQGLVDALAASPRSAFGHVLGATQVKRG
jgi:RNA polymerase sigma factor (sigma-70 family)